MTRDNYYKTQIRNITLLFLLLSIFPIKAKLNNEVAFYIDTYGEITARQDAKVAAAQRVFKRVRAVADRNSKRLGKLVVINNKTHAWAIALPAGHIVLSRQVLDLVHRNADSKLADARLAFVLGHELAHLANDDFWHHEVEAFMQDTKDANKISEFITQNFEAQQAELAADDKGYVYAAMAGYSVDQLISKKNSKQQNNNQDFFTFWMQQTNAQTSPSHPAAKDRAELLRQRLIQLNQKLVFFKFGTRLAHFGLCNDAIYFLTEFQKIFPGRSVLNNLGLCYLQQARSQMSQQQMAFYWLPLSLDARSRASIKMRGTGNGLKPQKQFLKTFSDDNSQIIGYLEEATNVLNLAIEKDNSYIPAKINLAIAYLYLGKPHQARAVLADAKQHTNNTEIEMLDALALYEQTDADIDLWATAIKKLERIEQKKSSPSVIYNHARLLSARPRAEPAQQLWNQLRAKVNQIPDVLRSELCSKQNIDSAAACLQKKKSAGTQPNWQWLFSTSSQPLTSSDRAKIQSTWVSIPFDWASANLHGNIHQRTDEDIEMLEMNSAIQLQVLRGNPVANINQLASYCQFPMSKRTLDTDEVWTCEDSWAVLVTDQQAREIWYLQQQM